MRQAPVIELTAEERATLEKTVNASSSAVRDVFRARIILLASQGWESQHYR